MKYLFLLSFIGILVSCNEPEVQTKTPADLNYTPVPSSTPITTDLMVYAIGNDQNTNPLSISTQNLYYCDYIDSYRGFGLNKITTDKYNSNLTVQIQLTVNQSNYEIHKTFTALSTTKNYINVKPLYPSVVGVVYPFGSGSATMNLPNDGLLTLSAHSFGNPTYGYPTASVNVYASYLNPSMTDYMVSLPCYPMADYQGKRWYLNSYGMYLLTATSMDILGNSIDVDPSAEILLKLAIPANLLENAPDSIPVWNISNDTGMWQKNGHALKEGNYYQTKISRKGFWNLAIPTDGIYATIHLKTTSDFDVANTRFTLKIGTDEVAEGRTDADGKALVFVPARKDIVVDIIDDHFDRTIKMWTDLSIGKFNATAEKTITLSDKPLLMNLKGNVFNCDGTPFKEGSVVLSTRFAKDAYQFSIKNGHFTAAQWINGGGYDVSNLSIRDGSGNSVIDYPLMTSSPQGTIEKFDVNFYTCAETEQLYCNYRIDTTDHKVSGNIKISTPLLSIKNLELDPTFYQIEINNNGAGVNFNVWFASDNAAYIGGGELKVNGVTCQYDYTNGTSEVFITRNDPTQGGFMEGWFYINYKDSDDTPHVITGNFRIKKI